MVFNTQGGLVVVRLLVIPDICHILTRIRWRILFQSLVLVVHDCSHNPGRHPLPPERIAAKRSLTIPSCPSFREGRNRAKESYEGL